MSMATCFVTNGTGVEEVALPVARVRFGVPDWECFGCYMGDDGLEMHDACYLAKHPPVDFTGTRDELLPGMRLGYFARPDLMVAGDRITSVDLGGEHSVYHYDPAWELEGIHWEWSSRNTWVLGAGQGRPSPDMFRRHPDDDDNDGYLQGEDQ